MSFIKDLAKEGLGSLASELLSVSVKFGADKASEFIKDQTGIDIKVNNGKLQSGNLSTVDIGKLKELDKELEIEAEYNRLDAEMGKIELEDIEQVNADIQDARELNEATTNSDIYLVKYIIPTLASITLVYTFIILLLPVIAPEYIVSNSVYLELVGLCKAMGIAVLVYLFGGSLGSYIKARSIKRRAIMENDESKGMF